MVTFRLRPGIISGFLPKLCPRLPHLLSSISSPSRSPVGQPATVKTHNIIERTANFVCQQGAQFEIVLKAKQAANSQFDFLRFDHYLNPYYKHVLRAMKEGRYQLASGSQQQLPQGESTPARPPPSSPPPPSSSLVSAADSQSDDSEDDGDGSYLHPSLLAPQKCSRLEELVKVTENTHTRVRASVPPVSPLLVMLLPLQPGLVPRCCSSVLDWSTELHQVLPEEQKGFLSFSSSSSAASEGDGSRPPTGSTGPESQTGKVGSGRRSPPARGIGGSSSFQYTSPARW